VAPLTHALIVVFLVAGCGAGTVSDPVIPADAGPSDATSVGTCDPGKQDCPPGQTCDIVCDGLSAAIGCRPLPAGGALAVGAECGEIDQCGAASGCFGTAMTAPAHICVRYCASDGDCAAGTTCQTRGVLRQCGVGGGQFTLRFCLP